MTEFVFDFHLKVLAEEGVRERMGWDEIYPSLARDRRAYYSLRLNEEQLDGQRREVGANEAPAYMRAKLAVVFMRAPLKPLVIAYLSLASAQQGY